MVTNMKVIGRMAIKMGKVDIITQMVIGMKVIGRMTFKKVKEYITGLMVNKYEGDWMNGNKNGKGIYYHNNGNKYEGYFKDGKADGKGIYLLRKR